MSLRTFVQMAIAQGTILRRSMVFLVVSLMIAAMSMGVFGWLFKLDGQAFNLAVVDHDGTQGSQALTQSFGGLDNLKVSQLGLEDEMSKLRDGNRGAVLVVPQGFAAATQAGSASLDVYYDNSNPIRIGYVTATVEAVVNGYNERVLGQKDAVKLQQQAVSTESVRFIDFLTPGMVGMTIMFTNLFGGQLLVLWRDQGILRRLGVTPLRPGVLIASQAVSFAAVSLVQVAIILLMGRFIFDVQIHGSYLWLAVTVFLGIFAMLAISYLIGSFLHTPNAVNAVINLIAFPMMFLGRSYFPMDPPAALNPVVQAIPLTHLNNALREIVNHGGALGDLWVSWVVLAGWIVANYLISMRLFRWQ